MLKIERSLYVYKSRRGEQAELKLRIKDACQTRVRYGYCRVHVLLKRDGWLVNPTRIFRLSRTLARTRWTYIFAGRSQSAAAPASARRSASSAWRSPLERLQTLRLANFHAAISGFPKCERSLPKSALGKHQPLRSSFLFISPPALSVLQQAGF
ncbi:IS3 family transposase [Rhizobium leguminosarum]|uniref:IS3 family transposase n=1 Tax=Rhizobium leguminosarum TaxID=384 RepID=UPI001C925279